MRCAIFKNKSIFLLELASNEILLRYFKLFNTLFRVNFTPSLKLIAKQHFSYLGEGSGGATVTWRTAVFEIGGEFSNATRVMRKRTSNSFPSAVSYFHFPYLTTSLIYQISGNHTIASLVLHSDNCDKLCVVFWPQLEELSFRIVPALPCTTRTL